MAIIVIRHLLPNDDSLGTSFLILTCILTSITIITTVLRMCARQGRRAIGRDDYAIMICCILAMIRTTIQVHSVRYGNGRHRWYLSKEDYEYVNFLAWLTQLFLFTNIALLKCSICLLILRIKNVKVLRYCLYTMMVGLVLTNVEPIIVLLTQCKPIKKYWKPSTPGMCWPTRVRIYSVYVQVAYSVMTDLLCAFLPAVVLWNVKISPSTKIGVCALMSLGLLATVTAIIRASSLGTETVDMSYDYCIAAIWANAELHLGIIATNLALSRMIWSFFTKKIRSPLPSHALQHSAGSGNASGFTKSANRGSHVIESLRIWHSVDYGSQANQISLEAVVERTPSPNTMVNTVEVLEDSRTTLEELGAKMTPYM